MIDGATFFQQQQSENDFMRNVIAYAEERGWLTYHTHIAKRSTEGFPDLCMARGGRLVFAELKRELPSLKSGRVSTNQDYYPTPAQERWIAFIAEVSGSAIRRQGDALDPHALSWRNRPVVGFLWRPSDWPEIERVLA